MFLLVIPGVILVGLSFLRWQFGLGHRRAKNIVLAGTCLIIVGIISWNEYADLRSVTLVSRPRATIRVTESTEELGIAAKSVYIEEVRVQTRPVEPSSYYVGVFENPQQATAVAVTVVVFFDVPGSRVSKSHTYYVSPALLELKYGPRTILHIEYYRSDAVDAEHRAWYRTNSGQWKAIDPTWNTHPKYWNEDRMSVMEADDLPSGNPLMMP